uniref:Uncharacterized protein n=1 Tax=Salix viminalis TaxID=40686 RepID=A0A6N2N9H6_SALVM
MRLPLKFHSFLPTRSKKRTRNQPFYNPNKTEEHFERLPPSSLELTRPRGLSHPLITIFSAPTAPGSDQTLAIRSWLALSPQITVVLFTQHPSFASAFGSRVLVDSTIDFTFLGTPFFHSMLEKSRVYTTDITVFVDPRTVLVPDLISTLNYAYELDRDWLLVASLRNVSYFPFRLDDAGEHWLREDGQRVRLAGDAWSSLAVESLRGGQNAYGLEQQKSTFT